MSEKLNVIVDLELCDGHGQCEFAAPEVFRIDDEGELEFDPAPDASQRARVEQAIKLCPVQAIALGS
ncbi:MAG TPA: ferredoxin [Capillimicrobium sp.]|jgi:ferredoxin